MNTNPNSKLVVWVMDLNPDQAIAAGVVRAGSFMARALNGLLVWSFGRASRIVVLDRFMEARLEAKGVDAAKLDVIAPWPLDDAVKYDVPGRERFRAAHGLAGKFVVMYSGNHSPCHPLTSVLDAAARLVGETEIVFCFVGGGREFAAVSERGLPNVVALPYVPLASLSGSLSAADLHVVVMGDAFVGIVHPCKVYNVMELGVPFLYVGPGESHVAEVMGAGGRGQTALSAPVAALPAGQSGQSPGGYSVRHGDVDGVVAAVLDARGRGVGRRVEFGGGFSRTVLMGEMVGVIEGCLATNEREIG